MWTGGPRTRMGRPEASSALGRIATAVAVTSLGALSIGAAAVGVLAIRRLAVKDARVHRLEIDELVVGGRPFRAGA
jgi:hypothetical protein